MKIKSSLNVFFIVCIIIFLLGILFIGTKNKSQKQNNTTTTNKSEVNEYYDISEFDSIIGSDVNSFENDKIYVVLIGRKSCSFSKQIIDVFKELQGELKFKVQYLDLDKMINSDGKVIDSNSYTALKQLDKASDQTDVLNDLGKTPMTLIIKNKKIISSYLGYANKETMKDILKKARLKKK